MSYQNKRINIVTSTTITITIVLLTFLAGGILTCGNGQKPKEEVKEINEVKVYFEDGAKRHDCNCDDYVIRVIPKTKDVEKAAFLALEELIKGPTQEEQTQGYSGCLPDEGTVGRCKESYEKMVVDYKEKGKNIDWWGQRFLSPDGEFTPWEDRVKAKSVKIRNGIAYADFSKELYSYGGGSCFVNAIETSINNTLKQFPEVKEVKILVEGREAEIEP